MEQVLRRHFVIVTVPIPKLYQNHSYCSSEDQKDMMSFALSSEVESTVRS
jgi:hypothetical protein